MSQARIVLPLDARGQTLPIPRWQFDRLITLSAAGAGELLTWVAEQDDVILIRAVDVAADILVQPADAPAGYHPARLLPGQAIAQPIRGGEICDVQVLGVGRVEIVPFDRSGDAF